MKKIVILSLFASLTSVGFAAAQSAGAPGGETPPRLDRAERRAAFLAEADTNKDGTLSPEERSAARAARGKARFDRKDRNGDGLLSAAETPRMKAEKFASLDANQDGNLSREELQARPRGHFRGHKRGHGKARMFERMDGNKDGKITRQEIQTASEARFKRLDANQDGVVTRDEAKGAHGKKSGVGKAAGRPAEKR